MDKASAPRRVWWAAALALVGLTLALQPAQAQRRGAATVQVTVVDGEIRLAPNGGSVPSGTTSITWQLGTGGWRFVDGSIDFGEAASLFNCRVGSSGASITCSRSGSPARSAEAPYVIRLHNGSGLVEPVQPQVYISLD